MLVGRFLLKIAGKIVARPIRRRIAAFHQATQCPKERQEQLLLEIIRSHASCSYGRDHHFDSIRTIADYRRQVPINPYENLASYIQRMMKGETNALVADSRVLMFALTSGTTASRKHIPITQRYLEDYRRGWNIWGLTAMREHPAIKLKPVMQLVGDPEEFRSDGGIPCGNLSGFTAQVQKRIIRFLYSVPAIAGKIKDSHSRYYVALRFSIGRQVGLLSSANPSTLVALARVLDQEKENLIRDLADGTLNAKLDLPQPIRDYLTRKAKRDRHKAAQLEQAANREGALRPSAVWPTDKILLGCWTGGSVGPYLRQLSKYYADTPVRDIGLLASEGRFTIPLQDTAPSGVLDIMTHYFEFVPEAEIDSPQPTVLGAHELREGAAYYILPTTNAGLYRYHISDLVRVTGFHNQTPLIEFLGKGNRFANLTGEKLSEHHVTKAMDAVAERIPLPISAYALAPCWDETQPYYGVFLEVQDVVRIELIRPFLDELDAALGQQNIEYEAKRASGRLGPPRVEVLPQGTWRRWDAERLEKTGGSPEQYKHPCLIGDLEFRKSLNVVREFQ
jgi:GH3 auxin-responsive promoter